MPAKVLACPARTVSLRSLWPAGMLKIWRSRHGRVAADDFEGLGGIALAGGQFCDAGLCSDEFGPDKSGPGKFRPDEFGGLGLIRNSADPVRARQWRPCRALDHHAVADGIEWRSTRPPVRYQFHRSPRAQRRQRD